MPRRKTQRKPKRNENCDPDASILADGADDKVLKKEAFMRDFDIQVQERVHRMESEMKSIMTDINKLFTTQKFEIKKEIRQMKVTDFIAAGGDMKTLDFTAITSELLGDVSFHANIPEEEQDVTFKAPISAVRRSTRKQNAHVTQSPLVLDAPLTRQNRTRKGNNQSSFYTPHVLNNKKKVPLSTPFIQPKFDTRKPLTIAREPRKGETLLSLAGSPVVESRQAHNDTNQVVSLLLSKQQTLLSGSLFDMTMSPNTLMTSKERLQEAMNAINSRLDNLDMQLSGQSKLDDS